MSFFALLFEAPQVTLIAGLIILIAGLISYKLSGQSKMFARISILVFGIGVIGLFAGAMMLIVKYGLLGFINNFEKFIK